MAMKNFLLGLSKFVLGIILAMLIMSLAGLSMARYFMTRMVEQPERPTYENDLPEDQRPVTQAPDAGGSETFDEPGPEVAAPEPEPEPELEPEPARTNSADGYAIVNQPVGLILRSGPGTDYRNIGGIDYQESVEVIAEEGGWLNVILSNGEEGWIKDGNVSYE
ncbi:MAG: SH3 domain-containing protein [Cyanobacteria bacterium J06598_3]